MSSSSSKVLSGSDTEDEATIVESKYDDDLTDEDIPPPAIASSSSSSSAPWQTKKKRKFNQDEDGDGLGGDGAAVAAAPLAKPAPKKIKKKAPIKTKVARQPAPKKPKSAPTCANRVAQDKNSQDGGLAGKLKTPPHGMKRAPVHNDSDDDDESTSSESDTDNDDDDDDENNVSSVDLTQQEADEARVKWLKSKKEKKANLALVEDLELRYKSAKKATIKLRNREARDYANYLTKTGIAMMHELAKFLFGSETLGGSKKNRDLQPIICGYLLSPSEIGDYVRNTCKKINVKKDAVVADALRWATEWVSPKSIAAELVEFDRKNEYNREWNKIGIKDIFPALIVHNAGQTLKWFASLNIHFTAGYMLNNLEQAILRGLGNSVDTIYWYLSTHRDEIGRSDPIAELQEAGYKVIQRLKKQPKLAARVRQCITKLAPLFHSNATEIFAYLCI